MNTDRFRFRVWDESNKRYIDTFSDPYNRIWRWYIDIDGNLIGVEEDNVDRVQDKEKFIIEQCTGLKDKNGKLIFEGDIVRLSLDGTDKLDREVYYCEYNCKWFMRLCCSFEWGKEYQYYDFNAEKARDFEIIGNVHDERKENE